MLAQHLVTKPVFDALFNDYSFALHNPMSKAMQGVLDALQEHNLDKEADTLQRFYDSVKMRADGIDNAAGKQKIIVELYDKFFRNAFPKMTERLGIVYTPVEVVDFIIHSVDHILKTEFGQTLGSDGVHIIDPFAGTGTFITRLLQSGLITPEQLPGKYKNEIHANELVLLAYYIAAINIEAVYHSIAGGDYVPFEGICLTDTFQMYEKEDLVEVLLVDNSARRKRQKKLDIRVIVGNPPYSSGDKNDNNNKNIDYPFLDQRISETYVASSSKSVGKSKIYDSYIRAIRWASDRVGHSGVIGLATNAGYLDSNTTDGLRKCLEREFSSIYIFHLRGNARTAGELRRKEKDNVFGMASRAPIAISLLVKNPAATEHGKIYFHDIGDYLSREEKLEKINMFFSIAGISQENGWQTISPDDHGDWLSQRSDDLEKVMELGRKSEGDGEAIFRSYSMGIKSNRDDWVYGYSKLKTEARITSMIEFFNQEASRYQGSGIEKSLEDFVNRDKSKIKWTSDVLSGIERGRIHKVETSGFVRAHYRPFCKQWIYSNKEWNWSRHLMPSYFPDIGAGNELICVTGLGSTKEFCAFITNTVPDLELISKGQCFPKYIFERSPKSKIQTGLFSEGGATQHRREALTDEGLALFQTTYAGETVGRDDVFYYVYGLLHSNDYRERYADNLSKELPRIPCVKTAVDFWAFSQAGRNLAELHLNYETVEPYPVTVSTGGKTLGDSEYRVEKMRYGKKGKDKDLTTLHYNARITLTGIPLEAYEYVVNGKPALDWVVERQCVKTDKDSGIVNDANDWATETMGNPRYPLELFQRVITVSLETMKIVKDLPPLDI